MRVRDFSISKGMVVNLGGFNSHRVEVGMTAIFDEGDDLEQGIEKLTAMVNLKLATEITQAINDKSKKKSKKQILMENNQQQIEPPYQDIAAGDET